MNEATLRRRLRIHGWSATNYAAVRIIIQAAEQRNRVIRTCWTSGSGRFTSNQDHHEQTKRALRHLGLDFTEGNDATRGGATGQWIKLSSTAMKKLGGISREYEARKNIKKLEPCLA